MTCLKALSEAARLETNIDTQFLLRGAWALLDVAIKAFMEEQTTSTLTNLNGVWAYASRVLKLATPSGGPTSTGGRLPAPRQQERLAA